jgi:hypothetical protein
MAKHRNSPHVAFWKMIKQGYDSFEVTHLEPKVDVCERRYVFNAETSAKFSAADKCPAFKVPEDIAAAVRDKQQRDETQTAELISRGTPALPAKMNVDGGMNPTFLSAVKFNGGPGATIHTAAGTIPPHVNPPAEPADTTTGSFFSLASTDSKPAPAPAPRSSVQVASASSSGGIGGFISNLFASKGDDQKTESAEVSAPKTKPAKPAQTRPSQTATAAGAIRPKSEPQPAETKTAAKPQPAPPPRQEASAVPGSAPPADNNLLNGAAPTVPSGGFENRFGAWR